MNLQFQYDPVPENSSRFAADVVRGALDVAGVTLDYSVESLKQLDDMIDGWRSEGCTTEQMAEILFGFGCYVGEVLVRHAGATWHEAANTSMAEGAGFPLVIQGRSGAYGNPIGKVFKRMENGSEDSLSFFYTVMASLQKGPAAPPPAKPWWKFWSR